MADDTIELARLPDVLLLVTKGDDIRRYKVNSFILRHASQVFEEMLSPRFAEVQALATTPGSLCEIKLADDDPRCMQLILYTIHLQHDKLPERIDCDVIVNLAIAIDKYFLHQAMKFLLDKWLVPVKTSNLHSFLQAAIILEHAESLKQTTRFMLLDHARSYSTAKCADKDVKFLHIIIKIDGKREICKRKLMCAAYNIIENSTSSTSCADSLFVAKQLLKRLHELDVETEFLRDISLAELEEKVIAGFTVKIYPHATGQCISKSHSHPDPGHMKIQIIVQGHARIEGLCFDCEERDYNGVKEGPCRFGHNTTA